VLGLLPDPTSKEAVKAGLSKVRANMDRAFHTKSQELAAERRRIAEEKAAAAAQVQKAMSDAKQWLSAIEDDQVQEVLSALQNDAAYQIEVLKAERDEALAQAEATKIHIDNVAAAVREALSREYDERMNALRTERESERAELEAARAARAEAEAAQARLREEEERRQTEDYAKRIAAAAEGFGGLLPSDQASFDALEPFFQTASRQVARAKGLTNEAIDALSEAVEEAIKLTGRLVAAAHPKPADAPAPANPNAVRPPATAEALATQSKSGNGGVTGKPNRPTITAVLY
jgi:YesN/AraC family two-component response regulator